MKMYAIVDLLEYRGNICIVYQLDYKIRSMHSWPINGYD